MMFRVEIYEDADDMAEDPYVDGEEKDAGNLNKGSAEGSREEPVGKLTIAAYTGAEVHPMPHGFLTLTTYEDLDLNVSCYAYYKPNEKYTSLMEDYAENPDKYSSDPALYNDNALGLTDRESYFDEIVNGPNSDPMTISLKAGESVTIANSAHGETNIPAIISLLESSTAASSKETAELIKQLQYYAEGSDQFSIRKALRGGIGTVIKAYKTALKTGYNPIDGVSPEGGLFIDKELQNQFASPVNRFPNNYYTVEITAEELTNLQDSISDPSTNYFSFFGRNCAATASRIWNATLSDRPEYRLRANFTGFSNDPLSLYVELRHLRNKKNLDGQGGSNFSPRTLAFRQNSESDVTPEPVPQTVVKDNPMTVKGKTASIRYAKLKKNDLTIKTGKVMRVKKAQGTLTYKKLSGSSKIRINSGTGKVTVKKGLKKKTYKVKVRVSDSGNALYKAGSKTVTFKIRIK